MPYVTSWERIGEKIGEQRGQQKALCEAILENLAIDHGHVPDELAQQVQALTDLPRLRGLVRASVRVESLDAFRRSLEA